ncbi:MAG: type II 3-dehydroquinate dehydratase [Rikenellaceae bacterium]|jgi:3-dehydroquinate dehydratase-2|nr:type II 3-dehydroquinate dehydratase [Rikenellaceae bacterium]
MAKKVLIVNGPNLNLLGKREPGIYGATGFEEYFGNLQKIFPDVALDYYQSNIEGELIDTIHAAAGRYDGVVLNAGGYTHTSVALADAIGAISVPVVEVHISCILAREAFRHTSLIAPRCKGSVMGFGLDSYRLGILALIS